MQRNAMSIRGIALCVLCSPTIHTHTLLVPPRRAFREHGKAKNDEKSSPHRIATEGARTARNLARKSLDGPRRRRSGGARACNYGRQSVKKKKRLWRVPPRTCCSSVGGWRLACSALRLLPRRRIMNVVRLGDDVYALTKTCDSFSSPKTSMLSRGQSELETI